MKEFGADAIVEPDPARHFLDVRADRFAKVRYLVDEADLGRKESVGGIFGKFRRPPGREKDRRLVEE